MQSNNSQSGGKLGINIVENKDGALVYLSGRVDIESSPAFRNRLLALIEGRRAKRVSVDLFAITQIDSSGIATLIEALKIAHAYQTELTLQGLHDDLLRLSVLIRRKRDADQSKQTDLRRAAPGGRLSV